MFENVDDLEDVIAIGIEPVRYIVEAIEINDNDSKMVCGLANAAVGILEDLSKCVERIDNEQRKQAESAEVGRSHVSE